MAVSNSTRSRGKETGKSATRDSIVDIWGARTPYSGEWPERVDERTLDEPERWVRAACALCSAGCALDIGMKDGRIVGVHGRAVDRVNRGCPCDYTGVTYVKLSQGSGIPWPCNEKYPDGAERLYTNGKFSTDADYCEICGHDLMTGAAIEPEKYRANNPKGKAILKAADYVPPPEKPDDEYPFFLTTGRVVYHWHTRTKTKRAPDLDHAAPDVFVQISAADAEQYGISEGDMVEVTTRRGTMEAPARIGDIEPGYLFIPLHYGYWVKPGRKRAANELTISGYDPVSKQPFCKLSAAQFRKVNVLHYQIDTVLVQAAMAKKDRELLNTCTRFREQTNRQSDWICTQLKLRSPQVVT